MKGKGLLNRLLAGAAIGAVFGAAIIWIMTSRDYRSRAHYLQVQEPEPITLGEFLGLGFALMKVGRQAAELVRKV